MTRNNNNPFHILDIPHENIYNNLDNVNNDLKTIMEYMKFKIDRWKNIRKSMTKKEYNET